MDYQECLYKGKFVWVVSLMSASGKLHRYVKPYIGRGGLVIGTAKNNMLLIEFGNHYRAIPSGCVVNYNVKKAGEK